MDRKSLGAFVLGFVACAFLFSFGSELEVPFTGLGIVGLSSEDISAPSDHVELEDIVVLDDRVILRLEGVTLSSYADSGSMVPFLDKGANGIRIVPSSEEDIEVGDIVSFRVGRFLVVHRVAQKGVDDEGVWFAVKGDANLFGDGKIRFSDIEYLTIAIIY